MGSSSDVTAMQNAFDENINGGWVKADNYYNGEKSGITAFAVVFDDTVTLNYNEKLQLVYKAAVPRMTETEAAARAHLATYNDFRLLYQMQVGGVTGSDVYTLDSNYVYVLLETEAVGVGGMAWIDADGDGKQESEDVTLYTHYDNDTGEGEDTATTYNSRTNNYASYNVVSAMLDSITVQLNIYSGSAVSTLKTFSLLNAGNSWRFLFDGLTTANISSAYNDSTAYDDDGILWKALAGSTNATWYQLVTTVAGSDSIKYSLTGATTDMMSYDPADMYDDTVTGVLNDSNFRTSAGESGTDTITTGSTTAYSEKFFLYSGDEWNLAEDIGLVIYRDLTITKNDTNGSSPEAGSTFVVYGPYAKGEASKVTSLDNEKVVATYKTTETNPSTASFTNLLYFQEYIIVETEADSSYELGKAVATGTNITAITDGIKKGETTYTSAWILNIPGDSSNTDPAANNTYTTDNMTVTNAKKMTIEFTKVQGDDFDENNPTSATTLAGAVFELYSAYDVNDDGTPKDSAKVLYEATSDASGAVKFAEGVDDGSGNVTYNYAILDGGTYYVYETKAPDGYVLPATNYWKVTSIQIAKRLRLKTVQHCSMTAKAAATRFSTTRSITCQ